MTSEMSLRYGTWFCKDNILANSTTPLQWVMTPRSKKWQCIETRVTLPVPLKVVQCTSTSVKVSTPDDDTYDMIATWCTPEDAYPPTRNANGHITLHGPISMMDGEFKFTDTKPDKGNMYWFRIFATCNKLCGDMYKTTLHVSGILQSSSAWDA